jgi:hypothetical protein
MADAFKDRIDSAYKAITGDLSEAGISGDITKMIDVPEERKFVGFDGYKQAIALADVVILTTPPGFRPFHFEEAVNQNKHLFMEKPVATDPEGIKKVLAAAKKRNIFNDVESTGNFCIPIPKLQRYRFLPDRATVMLSANYTDDHAAYYSTQDLADAAFDYLKTPLAILALHIYKLDMNLASGRNMRSVPSFNTVNELKDAENVIGLTPDEKIWCASIYKNSTDYIKFS